jgi:rhodanese-related sulfurtransferase
MTDAPIPTVDVREAASRLDRAGPGPTPLLLDVRETSEFEDVRADGARLLPMSEVVARHEEIPKDRPLLVICQAGGRSAAVAGFLLRSGWSDVTNVAGGTTAWQAAGLPVRHGPPDPEETLAG